MENTTGAPPTSFEDLEHDVRVPRFGGAALLRAAARALHEGFAIRRVEFGGASETSLSDSTQDEVSAEVVDALAEHGPSGAQGLLRHEYRTFIVEGVEFYSQTTRSVTLRRDGVIFGTSDDALWIFIHRVLEEDPPS
ncbi:hypothetical protein [Microbacterium aurantiacum]|uniref:hypothetical protein n=1 Tax=Microbacterium aurantiacum TaxID=162393 RepID=UPI001F1CAB33|nr:hypothetical protein [Microbacterium aurantiacum]